MAKSFRENPVLAAAALSAARNLVTTEEAVLGAYCICSPKNPLHTNTITMLLM
jgi:hypothetical protein